MKKKILAILFALTAVGGYAQAQNTPPEGYAPTKVVVFSFVTGDDVFMLGLDKNNRMFEEVMTFIDTNKEYINDGSMSIFVYAYCGKGGAETTRAARVKRMSNHVKGEMIRLKKAKESNFVTSTSLNCYSDTLANAVILKFYLPFDYEIRKAQLTEMLHPMPEPTDEGSNKKESAATPVNDSLNTAIAKQQPEQEEQSEAKTAVKAEEQTTVTQVSTTEPVKEQPAIQQISSPWYVGGGIGTAFGRTTFASFAADETYPGFSIAVLGGYKISKRLSVEATLNYTRLPLGAYDCCQNLYLAANGNRYLAPVTGMANYRYSDLLSTANLIELGVHLNIDLVSLWRDNARWSALVAPAIYGVYSSATIKQNNTQVRSENGFHFGAGLDLGAEYRIDGNWSLRLTTGMNYLTGAFDGLPREEHKTSYVWNTALKVIYKW